MGNLLNPYRFATSGYTASATNFDGTNDYMLRGAALTGAVDGSQFTFSGWLNLNGGDGSRKLLFCSQNGRVLVDRDTSNKIHVVLQNTSGTAIAEMTSTSTYTAGATWYHILISVDTAVANSGYMYINDAQEATDNPTAGDIDYSQANWAVGSLVNGTSKMNGCMSEIWAEDTYLDLSTEANRRKFISATGKPVDLGSDGSTPTGASPLVYLPNPFGSFETNAGTGGNFTVTGALTACADSPSD